MNNTITGRDIRNQLKADLIGKDSYRGVTLTYTWLANQFGHISLGFIPTFILYIILSRYYNEERASFWAAVLISAAWFIFETFNFLGPLLFSNLLKKKCFFEARSAIYFPACVGKCCIWYHHWYRILLVRSVFRKHAMQLFICFFINSIYFGRVVNLPGVLLVSYENVFTDTSISVSIQAKPMGSRANRRRCDT